jgi:hypothetical protein
VVLIIFSAAEGLIWPRNRLPLRHLRRERIVAASLGTMFAFNGPQLQEGSERDAMLRISRLESNDGTAAIKIEGKLLAPWLEEVHRLFPAEANELAFRLDLSDLSYADAAGTRLLKRLLALGVEIRSCSPYVAELLHWNPNPSRK